MNTEKNDALKLAGEVKKGVGEVTGVDIVICPPFVFIDRVVEKIRESTIRVGAQNVFFREWGAYTGEISPPMLKSVGCEYVIIGHSERRSLFYESDAEINRKIKMCIAHGLSPVFCIGETYEQKNAGNTEDILNNQVIYGLEGIDDEQIMQIIIAYEPVWAIGTGISATGENAERTHIFIRNILSDFTRPEVAENVRIIYGGSVNTANALELLRQENIDGALIGGASLKAETFSDIVKIANSLVNH